MRAIRICFFEDSSRLTQNSLKIALSGACSSSEEHRQEARIQHPSNRKRAVRHGRILTGQPRTGFITRILYPALFIRTAEDSKRP